MSYQEEIVRGYFLLCALYIHIYIFTLVSKHWSKLSCMSMDNYSYVPYLLVTSAWFVIYIIPRSALGLSTLSEVETVIFNLHSKSANCFKLIIRK